MNIPGHSSDSHPLKDNVPSAGVAVASKAMPMNQWFTEEVHAHDKHLRVYLRGAFPSVREVDDIVQESYLRIWKARSNRPIQNAKAFLFTIARHLAFDRVRRRETGLIQDIENLESVPVIVERNGTLETVSTNEKINLVAEGLMTLSPRCRQIVMLRKIKGLSRREIADQMEIAEKTVDIHLWKGIKQLGAHFRRHGLDS